MIAKRPDYQPAQCVERSASLHKINAPRNFWHCPAERTGSIDGLAQCRNAGVGFRSSSNGKGRSACRQVSGSALHAPDSTSYAHS